MAPTRRTRIANRIARSRVPVNPTFRPSMNVPAWLGTVMAALAALPTDWPWYGKVIVIVAGLAVGVTSQFFTRPAREALDHGDDPLDAD